MKNIALPIRFGIYIGIALIAYFLLLSLLHLHTNPVYSFFNSIITAVGIYSAIKQYKLKQGSDFEYPKGFSTGIIAGFIATLIFSIFFLVYSTEINPSFLDKLLVFFEGKLDLKIGLLVFVVAIMGFASTVVVTLTCMQYFKNSWNVPLNQ